MSSAMTLPSRPTPAEAPRRRRLRTLLLVLKGTVAGWVADNAMRLSASLSLYTILSLAPLVVISTTLLGVVLRDKAVARQEVVDQVEALLGWQIALAVQPMIETGSRGGAGGGVAAVVSAAVLVFSATGVFAELQDSMNTIWGVKPKPKQGFRDFVRHRLLSLAMVFGSGFLLLVSMFVSAALTTLANYLAGDARWLAFSVDVVASFGVITLLFAGIFKFLPDVKLTWRNVWLGGVITAGLFTVGKYALALYFKYASPTSAFGAAGSLAAVMLWAYYSSFILFFGAEFTKVWSVRHLGRRIVPEEHAVKITEEDRAQRGIPSQRRLSDALAGRPLGARRASRPQRHIRAARRRAGPAAAAAAYALSAAAGMAIGFIAGSLRTNYALGRKDRGGQGRPVRR